ncbi:TPA: hypothetical protein ACH3X2_008937 [Trebouxia sp. C0005]
MLGRSMLMLLAHYITFSLQSSNIWLQALRFQEATSEARHQRRPSPRRQCDDVHVVNGRQLIYHKVYMTCLLVMLDCKVPIIIELYRHVMYHVLHITKHFVTGCNQGVPAMCELAQSDNNSSSSACRVS